MLMVLMLNHADLEQLLHSMKTRAISYIQNLSVTTFLRLCIFASDDEEQMRPV